MKKKILCAFLVCGLILSTGCGKKEEPTNNNGNGNTVEKDEVKELSLDDATVVELLDKIDFPLYVKGSIYKIGNFTLDTIPNDLILRIGFSNMDIDESMTIGGNVSEGNVENVNGAMVWRGSKELLANHIKNIFGDVNYQHGSFINTDVIEFAAYPITRGDVTYSKGMYSMTLFYGGGGWFNYIVEKPYKAQSINNGESIEIYVKTSFEQSEIINDSFSMPDFCEVNNVYKNYNFESDTFTDKVTNVLVYGNVSEKCQAEIIIDENTQDKGYSQYESKLDSYVYTFTKQADGKYYLSGFRKA